MFTISNTYLRFLLRSRMLTVALMLLLLPLVCWCKGKEAESDQNADRHIPLRVDGTRVSLQGQWVTVFVYSDKDMLLGQHEMPLVVGGATTTSLPLPKGQPLYVLATVGMHAAATDYNTLTTMEAYLRTQTSVQAYLSEVMAVEVDPVEELVLVLKPWAEVYGQEVGGHLAFPHAEGYGRLAKGGRGGSVYYVTTLQDYNPGKKEAEIPGSLRYGIEKVHTGAPLTILFKVSGNIRLKTNLTITKSYLTIAGQSAPGDGITLCDYSLKFTGKTSQDPKDWLHDIIVRFIRVRYGDVSEQSGDAITANYVSDYIFDHISASWSVDGLHDMRGGGNFTLQWSIYAEALNRSTHYKNQAHAMLASFRDIRSNISIHHNVMSSSRNRHPTLGAGDNPPAGNQAVAICDFRNNVVHNWEGGTNLGEVKHELVNNYYKPGESSNYGYDKAYPLNVKSIRAELARGYVRGNYFENAPPAYNTDNYTAIRYTNSGKYSSTTRAVFEVTSPLVSASDRPNTHTPQEAYTLVLNKAGASLVRDAADTRIVNDVLNNTGKLIDSETQVGGWPVLQGTTPPKDTDSDGIPDDWERARGLDPTRAADGNHYSVNPEYTNLEVYLNGLVEHLYP